MWVRLLDDLSQKTAKNVLNDFFGQHPRCQILSSDNASDFGLECSSMLSRLNIRHNTYTTNMSEQRGAIEIQIHYFCQILRRLIVNTKADNSPIELLLLCTANSMNSQKALGSQ